MIGSMPNPDCEECLRLSREYLSARTESKRLDAVAMRAMGSNDFRTSAAAAEEAADRRTAAREAITLHCSVTGHRVDLSAPVAPSTRQ
jgi:hypothetical protein